MTNDEKNYVSLKEHFESRVSALEKATEVATNVLDKRLDSMNEFRAQLKDQASTFVSRIEHEKVMEDLRELREWKSKQEGKASQMSFVITLIISLSSLFIALVTLFSRFI